jgi:hypothetical protein
MTNKTVKREGVVHLTVNGKISSVKFAVSSDLHVDFPRGGFGGHVDNEPMKLPVMRESKEERKGFLYW